MKPVINLDELEVVSEEDGPFVGRYGVIGQRIGAQKLGYNLTICPPGKKVCPFHNHRVDEEMFFILEGEGLLRFGDREYPLRKNDIVACPPGGRDVAHQIVNTGGSDLKYLALSTMERCEVCEYPDSNKVGVFVGKQGSRDLRLMFRAENTVDYFDRETR
jgi:uncharacterized cupin superfamily protein